MRNINFESCTKKGRVTILLSTFAATIILSADNYNLNDIVLRQENLLKILKTEDSIKSAKTKEYSEVITKYINDCKYIYDGKSVSSFEMIKLFNDAIHQNEQLTIELDSLNNKNIDLIKKGATLAIAYNDIVKSKNTLQDSIQKLDFLISNLELKYPFKYKLHRKNNYLQLTYETSKLDSALTIFPYVRNNLSFDSINNYWIITHFNTIKIPKKKDKK